MQAVATNVIGTENVLNIAIKHAVSKVIVLSTDKAVYPINAMGISKAMMEKVAVAKSRNLGKETTICCTRYGNVMASRGSVIPLFIDQIRKGKEITITDPSMTRFMMSLDDAVDLVMFAFENGKNGDIFVQKAPAATIELLAHTLKNLLNRPEHIVKIIGTRHGEKLYETLLTREEMEEGDVITEAEDYHSHNTHRLNENEMKKMLLDLREIAIDLKEFEIK